MDDESSDTDIMEESDYEPSLIPCEVVTQGVTDIMIEEEDYEEDYEDDDYGQNLAIASSDNEGLASSDQDIISQPSLIPPVPPPESGYISHEEMPMNMQDEMKNEFPVEEDMDYHPTPGGDFEPEEDEVVQHQASETVVFIDDKKPVQMPILPKPMSIQPLPKPEYELYAESTSSDNDTNVPSGMVIPPALASNVIQTEEQVYNNQPQSLPQYEYEESDEDETDIKDIEEQTTIELIEHKPQSIPPPFVISNIVKSDQKKGSVDEFKEQEDTFDAISAVSTGEYNNSELNANAERYNKAMSSAEVVDERQTTEVMMDMSGNNIGYKSKQIRFSGGGSEEAGENFSHYDDGIGTKKGRIQNYDNLHTWPMNVAVSCALLVFLAITAVKYFGL